MAAVCFGPNLLLKYLIRHGHPHGFRLNTQVNGQRASIFVWMSTPSERYMDFHTDFRADVLSVSNYPHYGQFNQGNSIEAIFRWLQMKLHLLKMLVQE